MAKPLQQLMNRLLGLPGDGVRQPAVDLHHIWHADYWQVIARKIHFREKNKL
jgi:hypothetical protein